MMKSSVPPTPPAALPPLVAAYVDATNSFDPERLMATFAEDALVNDQLRDYWGKPSIREWAKRDIMSNRVQSRPPFASNIDPPCAGWNPPGARQCDNQDEKAPPLSLRSEGVARPRERQRRRGKILAVAMAWRGTCRVRREV